MRKVAVLAEAAGDIEQVRNFYDAALAITVPIHW
jgi:hypothetical protein